VRYYERRTHCFFVFGFYDEESFAIPIYAISFVTINLFKISYLNSELFLGEPAQGQRR
jgi:hypothetical protein